MINLSDVMSQEDFLKQQKPQGYDQSDEYFKSILLPVMINGNWDELELMPVIFDDGGKPLIYFKEDVWNFYELSKKGALDKGTFSKNIFFYIPDPKRKQNPLSGCVLERNIKNQLKCFVLAQLYFSPPLIAIESINSQLTSLIRLVAFMLDIGKNNLSSINIEKLCEWSSMGLDLLSQNSLVGINALAKVNEYLPFNVNIMTKVTHKKLGITAKEITQHPVIPPRIYFPLLTSCSNVINELYQYRDDLEAAMEMVVRIEQARFKENIKEFRHKGVRLKKEWLQPLSEAMTARNIPLIDKEESSEWMEVFDEVGAVFKCGPISVKCKIGQKVFNSIVDVKRYCSELVVMCRYMCLALSGMRVDELYRLSPVWGAQAVKIEGQTIFLLSTRQSKITMNSQTKDDVFVTTETGYRAYQLLNAIQSPVRALLKSDKSRFNVSLKVTTVPTALTKNGVSNSIIKWVNSKKEVDLILTLEDVKYLNQSNPDNDNYNVGGTFKITNHQLRRSLAFYLVGYELLSFPQLKQQLSHFSMAMTRWYARNASSYKLMYQEIQNERDIQQADIWVRVMTKMANKERIGGGKGKAKLRELAKQGEIYFDGEDNKKNSKLSKEYWQNQLKNNKGHLHAIAPGMYCTNQQCSMRLNIDLSECVDCEFDIIENVVYAETSRMDAMRNINYALEVNELNSSLASKYVMQITSAERIMKDLDFDYEPFIIPRFVRDLLILTKGIDTE